MHTAVQARKGNLIFMALFATSALRDWRRLLFSPMDQ